jgi:lysozyme
MLKGIDVSHWDEFSWNNEMKPLVLSKQLYFAYAKASEGTHSTDGGYDNHRTGSANIGLLHGAFHFFLPTQDVQDQVKLFSQKVGARRIGELPPAVDIEWTKVVNQKTNKVVRPELWDQLTAAKRLEVTIALVKEVEKVFGVKPVIYTHPNFWHHYIEDHNPAASLAQFAEYVLWNVDLKNEGTLPKPWMRADFVQTHFGESASAHASLYDRVDQDRYDGTLKQLLSLTMTGLVFDKTSTPVCQIVWDLQQSLKDKGFYPHTVDGDFGNNTELAVKDFQRSAGLNETGIVDESVWKLLV